MMKTPKKLTALVLMGALVGSSVAVAPASAMTFSDVPSSHWAYGVIDEVSDAKVMVGVGNNRFNPNTQITRAEYSAILYNLAPSKADGDYDVDYSDVASGAWYAGTARWAVSNGIIDTVNGKFAASTMITRELMADMTYNFLRAYYQSTVINNSTNANYSDLASISKEYRAGVNALTYAGLLAGRGNNEFVPKGTLTRAEAAAMASRVMNLIADLSPDEPVIEPEDPTTDPEDPVTPETPSDEPGTPADPEEPTTDPEEPSTPSTPEEDPNDPANWDLEGAPAWFLVGKPDSISNEMWQELITYYADKQKPTGYPSSIPSYFKNNESGAKAYLASYMERILYEPILQEKAANALEAGSVSLSPGEQEMVSLVNSLRASEGAGQLTVSPALCKAAEIRAKEVLIKTEGLTYEEVKLKGASYFHSRPDGSNGKTVLKEDNVGLISPSITTSYFGWGENLSLGYRTSTMTASQSFSGLKASSAHHKNMVDDKFTHIGVAFYSNGIHSAWIQVFSCLN